MTTATIPLGAHRPPGRHSRLACALKAEFIRLRSLRSTWICLVLVFIVGVSLSGVIAVVTAHAWNSGGRADRLQYDPVRTAQAGVLLAQFIAGVLGALAITGEYSSGLIRTTITSLQHRYQVFVAKFVALFAVLLVVGEVTAFSSFLTSRLVLLSNGGRVVSVYRPSTEFTAHYIPVLNLSSPGVLRATLLVGFYIACMGLLGLGLGFMLRHSAGTISLFVGVLLILPILVQLLPASVSDHFSQYLPSALGSAMLVVSLTRDTNGVHLLTPWAAALTLLAYVVFLGVLGLLRLTRSDA